MENSLCILLQSLIGYYTPVTYLDGEVEVVAQGLAGCDWPWIASAVLLVMSIYAVFRLIRCLIART